MSTGLPKRAWKDLSIEHSWDSKEWQNLKDHAENLAAQRVHLRELLGDSARCASMVAEFDGIALDYSRQRATTETIALLKALADRTGLFDKLRAMADGEHINITEDRAVMHIALRAPKEHVLCVDGVNVVPSVHDVLERMYTFAASVRSANFVGATGKPLTHVVSVGIGGSYLGPEFVYEALRTDATAAAAAAGRSLRFLANVDPVDAKRVLEGLDPESTLVVIVSKTFTTAETMLNARTLREWLCDGVAGSADAVVARHMVAVSANVKGAKDFGIAEQNVFGFWDWVGGRYSVCSAVGVLPLALQYGAEVVAAFLAGAHSVDKHVLSTPFESNIPVLLGVLGVWNSTFLGYPVRALLPYSQALLRFPAHIQQVDMESNGKRVSVDGAVLPFEAGEVNFGEPGTNGQHSFYQLIHQGRTVPCDFIGACESQQPIDRTGGAGGEPVSNHDELMSNFFAQPDALACGKTKQELQEQGVPEALWAHKEFPGNRPSSSLLFPRFDAKRIGQLLAIYEHRTAVQGFICS